MPLGLLYKMRFLLKHRQESAGSQAAQSCSSWDWAAMQHSLWCLSGPQACTTSMWTQLEPQRPGPYCSQRGCKESVPTMDLVGRGASGVLQAVLPWGPDPMCLAPHPSSRAEAGVMPRVGHTECHVR